MGLRKNLLAVVAGAALALPAVSLGASTLRVNNVDAWGGGSSGGPFEVEPTSFGFIPGGMGSYGASSSEFITFCVEKLEYLSNGASYDVSFSDEARFNGTGSTTDPLSPEVAFLYSSFVAGTLSTNLAGYNGASFTYGTEPDGAALQDAIWYLEGEQGAPGVTTLAGKLVSMASAYASFGWSGTGNVRVINMWDLGSLPTQSSANARQDLLVIVPTPTASFAGLSLLGAVGAVGVWRRRRSVEL